jgi:hypothetical protein
MILIGLASYYVYYMKYINVVVEKPRDNVIIIKELQTLPEQQKMPSVFPDKLPTYNNTEYQQIGILTSDETDKDPIVLPLFSRKIGNRSDRFNYYTATDKNNMMRLPITKDNNSCEDNIGCREIYNGDKINVEIYNGRVFTATIYKVDAPRYFADRY